MSELSILVPRIDDQHQDSFWYDGLIAKAGKYELYAAGDIRIYLENDKGEYVGMHDGFKARDGFVEPKNDKDLEKMYACEDGYRMDMNNWFEVVDENGDCLGDICDGYDDGIEWLKEVATNEYMEE
jgi:hypothetical protein